MLVLKRDESNVELELSAQEQLIINNALNWILHGPAAIEDWEFHTVIGANRSEAAKLLDEFHKTLEPTDRMSTPD